MGRQDIIAELNRRGAVQRLQGRDYVTFTGLIGMAHVEGITELTTELVDWDPAEQRAIFKATAKGSRGTFTGYGDACPQNVSKNMKTATIRMAETRAKCRALRAFLGCGMTAREELPGNFHDAVEVTSAPIAQITQIEEDHPRPNWTAAERRIFLTALKEKGITPKTLMEWAHREGMKNPGFWSPEERTDFIENPPEALRPAN